MKEGRALSRKGSENSGQGSNKEMNEKGDERSDEILRTHRGEGNEPTKKDKTIQGKKGKLSMKGREKGGMLQEEKGGNIKGGNKEAIRSESQGKKSKAWDTV